MKKMQSKRGVTLVIVMLCLLIFMTMIMGFTLDSRSQSVLNAGVKLHGYYRVSGEQVLNEIRANLADYWVTPDGDYKELIATWRFGGLLQGDFSTATPDVGKYGVLFSEGTQAQNSGLLELDYKVWVANNADDPANYLAGIQPIRDQDDLIDGSWDTDGKVVLTIQMFMKGETDPVSTVSHMVAVSGWDYVNSTTNVGTEGSGFELDNSGRGTLGTSDRLDLGDQLGVTLPATP